MRAIGTDSFTTSRTLSYGIGLWMSETIHPVCLPFLLMLQQTSRTCSQGDSTVRDVEVGVMDIRAAPWVTVHDPFHCLRPDATPISRAHRIAEPSRRGGCCPVRHPIYCPALEHRSVQLPPRHCLRPPMMPPTLAVWIYMWGDLHDGQRPVQHLG